MFAKAPSQQTQRVTGLQISDTAMGQTIPYVFGHARTAHKLIFYTNFQAHQQNNSSKKGGKAGTTNWYSVNADFMLGYGPFEGLVACWENSTWYYATYSNQVFTGVGTNTVFNFTISNNTSNVVLVMGVAYNVAYNINYSDYVDSFTLNSFNLSGSSYQPLYNSNFPLPNYGKITFSTQPYATYNSSPGSGNVTVTFPSSVTNPQVIVYYSEVGGSNALPNNNTGKKGGGQLPYQTGALVFERTLGSGASGNPYTYAEFSGDGGASIALGAAATLPSYNYEVKALFGLGNSSPVSTYNPGSTPGDPGQYLAKTTSGDCNPADIICDLICSGNREPLDSNFVWQHGLGFSNYTPSTDAFWAYSRFGGILKDSPNLFGGVGTPTLGLSNLRNYCLAYNIFISGTMDAQQSAAQLLGDIATIGNSAPVFDGGSLDFIPYCEISNYGNGASYVSPSAGGPLFDLTSNSFLPVKGKAPVEVTYDRAKDNFNSLQVGFKDARAQWTDNFVIISDTMDVTVQGATNSAQRNFSYITNTETAQAVGYPLLRRALLVERKEYKFALPAVWSTILVPMDLVTLNEPTISPYKIPVRIKTLTLDKKLELQVTAEPYIYGSSSPIIPGDTGTAQPIQNPGGGNNLPGNVNAPIIFEAVPGIATQPQIWLCVSGAGAYWGGAVIWISTDGGVTYTQIAVANTRQTMGTVITSTYPSHIDPDSANSLFVDLTQSFGILNSVSATLQNQFLPSLCYLQGGGTFTDPNGNIFTIPYELIAYQTVTLTAANKYEMGAITSTPVRRGAFNTPPAAHTVGNQFSFISDGSVIAINLPQSYIGTTLNFKFTSFNIQGANTQSLSDVSPYTFTPTGQVGFLQPNYTISPQPTVFQGQSGGWSGVDANSSTWTNTGNIYFPPVTATFTNGKSVKYAARDSGLAIFTVGGGGEVAWVTIYDPGLVGDFTGTALTAYADLNQTRWNSPGYIRIGTVTSKALSGGGGSGGGGGSNPGGVDDSIIYVPIAAGTYTAGQELFFTVYPRNVTFPVNLTGTNTGSRVNPTGTVVLTLKKNGVSIGTISITSGGVATISFAAAVSFNGTTDSFSITAPSPADSTFAGFYIAIYASRSN